MDPSSLILISVAAVAIMATAGAFAVAFRRSTGPDGIKEREPRPDDSTFVSPVAVEFSPPSVAVVPSVARSESAQVTLVESLNPAHRGYPVYYRASETTGAWL